MVLEIREVVDIKLRGMSSFLLLRDYICYIFYVICLNYFRIKSR